MRSDGSDMMCEPSTPRSTSKVPDFVSNATCFRLESRNSKIVHALASVAWPQSSTSDSGVNQRKSYRPLANEEGRFCEIVLVGDLLHQAIGEPGIERHDCSGISFEWLGSKCVDLP